MPAETDSVVARHQESVVAALTRHSGYRFLTRIPRAARELILRTAPREIRSMAWRESDGRRWLSDETAKVVVRSPADGAGFGFHVP